LEKSCKNIQNIKSKKWRIREKMGVTQTISERMENNMLNWYGHVLCMEDNRRPKWIMTWSPEGRRRRGRPEIKWKEWWSRRI
jgi:hypothetical protein